MASRSSRHASRRSACATESGLSYYLAYPRARRSERKIRLFRDWVLSEAEA
jgi:DNA-binding transcriptional LysR family regulator